MTIFRRAVSTHFVVLAFSAVIASISPGLRAGNVTYIYTDSQGTPLEEANGQGDITATFDYRPYGSLSLGQYGQGPSYTGHVTDAETGLVYMQQRYQDPVVGRFLTVDPIKVSPTDGGNFNRYWYASNNPYSNTDPDGRCDGPSTCRIDLDIEAMNSGRMSQQEFMDRSKARGAGAAIGLVSVVTAVVALPEAAAVTTVGGSTAMDSAALSAATEAASSAGAAGATQGATTGLVTESGEVFTGASTNAGGPGAATNPTVQGALDSVESSVRSAFHGCCGEIDAMSNAANSGARLQGSVMATVRAAGRQAGKLMEACSSCKAVAEKLGVRTVSPPPPPPPAPVPPPPPP